MNSENFDFFTQLEPILKFENVSSREKYRQVPSDWSIVLSDVRGSTAAIEKGRYKDVNLIGASTIAAIQNTIGTRDFPFVFGGDGATAVLPAKIAEGLKPTLARLRRLSMDSFGLDLRVGIIPVSEVSKRGGELLMGRYLVSPNVVLAVFQGGGLQVAENFLKKNPEGEKYFVDVDMGKEAPPLESLSCRWAPIKTRNGVILSVLIHAIRPEKSSEVYEKILKAINPIFDDVSNRPITAALKGEPFFKSLVRESKLRKDLGAVGKLVKIFLPMVFGRILRVLANNVPGRVYKKYLEDTPGNSDYKKLDDTLRMVVDCTETQASKFETVLNGFFVSGEVFYGIHRSNSALMTCIVEGLDPSQHIHFIDGADGGYAMAAKILKEQMRLSDKASVSISQS